jgi:hypothetical protein
MLYKYLNPVRADVIENLQIRFSQPSALNDPFEASALISLALNLDLEAESDVDATMEEFGIRIGDPNYESSRVEVIEAVRAHLLDVTQPCKIGAEVMERMEFSQGILSLSRTRESLLMWAHYGDSHKGFALGFDENHAFFKAPDLLGRPTTAQNVVYTTQRIHVDAKRDDFREVLLCTKSLEWAYEEEVRVFRAFGKSFSDFKRNTKGQVHLFPIPHDCIREVYFGANCNAETKARIIRAIDRHKLNVKVFTAHLLAEKYGLGFAEVPKSSVFSFRPRDMYRSTERQFSNPEMPKTSPILSEI